MREPERRGQRVVHRDAGLGAQGQLGEPNRHGIATGESIALGDSHPY